MKLVKHTFIEQGKLELVDDELIAKETERTLYFSLPLSALGLFEEEYNKPLVDLIVRSGQDNESSKELDSIEFSRALACSMYIKIKDGEIINDNSSKEEFKNMEIYKSIASNLPLRIELVKCAVACINDTVVKSSTNGDSKSKK